MPFLTDPVVIDHIKTLVVDGVLAIGWYTLLAALRKNKDEEPPVSRTYINAVYNDVKIFTDRVNNIGGIQVIELSASPELNLPTIVINEDTKRFVKSIENDPSYGDYQLIQGRVNNLFTSRNVVEIKKTSGDYIAVRLNKPNFDLVRYRPRPEAVIEFGGQPIIKLGQEGFGYDEFEADQVTILD